MWYVAAFLGGIAATIVSEVAIAIWLVIPRDREPESSTNESEPV